MQEELQALVEEAGKAVAASADLQALDQIRVAYLGRKGKLTERMKSLGELPPEERPRAGQAINQAKQEIGRASCRERV